MDSVWMKNDLIKALVNLSASMTRLRSGVHLIQAAASIVALASLSWSSHATTYNDTIKPSIFDSNSAGDPCTGCHHSSLATGAPRSFAPDNVNFNTYSLSTQFNDPNYVHDRANVRIQAGTMPTLGALNGTEMGWMQDWINDGAPLSAATATTSTTVSGRTKTSITVNGTVDTNVHSATTVPGTYFVQYSQNTSFSSSTSSTNRSSTASASVQRVITGLTCGTGYNYRFRATNGHGTSTATTSRFSYTSSCSAPVINVSGSPNNGPINLNVSKGQQLTNSDFLITATDTDTTSTLDWSISSAPASGTAFTNSINTASPAITYTAPANVPNPATVSFTVQVADETRVTPPSGSGYAAGPYTDTIVVNVTILDNPPTIDQGATLDFAVNEDSTGNVLQLSATDPDGDPLIWSTQVLPAGAYSGAVDAGDDTLFNITYSPVANADTVNADSFTVRVSDGAAFSEIVVSVDISPSPDDPVANDDPNFEVLVNSTNNALDVLANDTDVDTGDTREVTSVTTPTNSGVATINGAGPGNNILFTPGAGVVVPSTFNYTITDSDGRTDSALVTVSFPDGDGDGVIDYLDNCAASDNGPLQGPDNQADNDGDGVPFQTDNDPADPADPLVGGDVCDTDDDNDGMLDAEEAMFPGCLDPFVDDATGDCDGDGLDNITEITGGTDPTVDSVGPTLTAPADVIVDSTGYLTMVDVGTPSAIDGNDGAISTIAVGIDVAPTDIDECSELSNFSSDVPPLRPGIYTLTWATCDSADNPNQGAPVTQTVTVRPLVNTTVGQSVGENKVANLTVMLNGPTSVDVTVDVANSGTATPGDDYTPAAIVGGVLIPSGSTSVSIPINIIDDSLSPGGNGEFVEDIVFTLSNPQDAALGSVTRHTIRIQPLTTNITPLVDIFVTQGGNPSGTYIYDDQGNIVITANVVDPDGDNSLVSYDWTGTDNAFGVLDVNGQNQQTMSIPTPTGLTPGVYNIEVAVTDAGSPPGVTTASMTLNVVAAAPDLSVSVDCDGDGVADNTDCNEDGVPNNTEGADDSDGDGIPDYLDDSSITASNIIQNQTGDPSNSYLVQTDEGLNIKLGATALAAGRAGILLSQQDINDHGGQGGTPVANGNDGRTNTSGFFDFEITGLNASIGSANVVFPLTTGLRPGSSYRKFTPGSGWTSFATGNGDAISSAPGEPGVCPAPGSSEYIPGLNTFHYCVQLTIVDGGPNDADGMRDFVIRDPGGVAISSSTGSSSNNADAEGRIGVMHPLMLLLLVAPLAYVYRVKRKHRRH